MKGSMDMNQSNQYLLNIDTNKMKSDKSRNEAIKRKTDDLCSFALHRKKLFR